MESAMNQTVLEIYKYRAIVYESPKASAEQLEKMN
jgi:hypothetical protein